MIELLAITDDPRRPGRRCARSASGGLSALCAPASEREVTPEALWRHEALLEELMEERDLLPVRFGTLVPDEAAAARGGGRAPRRARGRARARARRRGAGAARRAARARARPRRPASGREYLRAKVARLDDRPGGCTSRSPRSRATATSSRAGSCCAPPTSSTATPSTQLRRAGPRLQRAHPELALLCTGPWPPYSFAGGEHEP